MSIRLIFAKNNKLSKIIHETGGIDFSGVGSSGPATDKRPSPK